MAQASKASMKDSKEKAPARHHRHHHHHNHASTSTSASVINSDPATKELTKETVQSRTSKKYVHLQHESIGRLTRDRKEDLDAQHNHDHNTSTTASTSSSTVRGINLPQAPHTEKNLFACHHLALGQQQCEHHRYDNGSAIASTSASTASRSTIRGDQSSTSEEVILDPGSQDGQLAGVGGWVEEYDDSYGGNYPQEVDLNGTGEPKEREREGEVMK
ncbi:uncharacterized protein Bfra_009792 [Botrytis fragariae]|uniref:Uncharacterized protein n=1 Tax=Botrytis fragariae TaxID=1964551 RepID=A0A8H6EFL7_9HELO|nr:uncharacterized protein Bfra_009792 [Botrytis fragariae]KAF5870406.1 hypothetical protein Bfra_009792 [Botrytis fragariae]